MSILFSRQQPAAPPPRPARRFRTGRSAVVTSACLLLLLLILSSFPGGAAAAIETTTATTTSQHATVPLYEGGASSSWRDVLRDRFPKIPKKERVVDQDKASVAQQQQQQERNLIRFGNAVCPLSQEVFQFRRDPDTGLYHYWDVLDDDNDFTNPDQDNTNGDGDGDTADLDNNTDGDNNTDAKNTADTATGGSSGGVGWSGGDGRRQRRQLQEGIIYDDDDDIIDVKVCVCLQSLHLPLEVCSAEFNYCLVYANNNVSCFQAETTESFVRSFWPVGIFWAAALLYALFCSEPGRNARRYMRRNFMAICCGRGGRPSSPSEENNTDGGAGSNAGGGGGGTPQQEEQQQQQQQPPGGETRRQQQQRRRDHRQDLTEQDLDRMLENEPERAAFLYRSYVLRQRRRRRRRQARQNRWWYRMMFGNPQQQEQQNSTANNNGDGGEANNGTNGGAAGRSSNQSNCYRLALKTKIFHAQDDDEEEDEQQRQGQETTVTTATTTTAEDQESTTTGNGNHNATPTSTTTTSSPTWSGLGAAISALRDPERVTLEEMDDEMEHGTRCAICLIRLEEGDVIGDIACGHKLHKDCLKDWLRRKNRCPLCQQAGIARLEAPTEDNDNMPPPPM